MTWCKARFGLFRYDSGYDRVAPTFPLGWSAVSVPGERQAELRAVPHAPTSNAWHKIPGAVDSERRAGLEVSMETKTIRDLELSMANCYFAKPHCVQRCSLSLCH
jgi:hypothetical protein